MDNRINGFDIVARKPTGAHSERILGVQTAPGTPWRVKYVVAEKGTLDHFWGQGHYFHGDSEFSAAVSKYENY